MGWQGGAVQLLLIEAEPGVFSGVFVYSPAAGPGNLIASIASAPGTDPYGNPYPAGIYAASGFLSGALASFQGANFVIDQSGIFFYQGIIPPPSGLGTPYLAGALANASGSSTVVIPVATATTTGDAVAVCANSNGTDTVTGVTDSAGNTYTQATTETAESNAVASTWVALNTTALTTSQTITVTYSGTAAHSAAAVGCAGVATASAVDPASGAAAANNAAPTFTSGTLAQPSELAIAFAASGNIGGAFTWAGWSSLTGGNLQTGSGPYSDVAAQVVNSNAPVKGSGSLNAIGHWSMTVLLLQAA